MIDKSEFCFNDFLKTCNILNTVTKMDVIFIDRDGDTIINLNNNNLPEILFNFQNDYNCINEKLRSNPPNSYYYYINPYNLEYIACGVWDKNSYIGFISIGPFISDIPSSEFISDIIYKNKIPINERNRLQKFYDSLSIINSNYPDNMGNLLVNLCSNKFVNSQLITSDVVIPTMDKETLKRSISDRKMTIELNYKAEKKLFKAIATGNKYELNTILKEDIGNFNFPDRIPESPLRSCKNLLFVLNTICRMAAESGGVHPVYVNSISEKFAILIERAPNLPYLKNLSSNLVNEYCNTVILFLHNNYSQIVKKTMEYINLNLESNLTLKGIADIIPVNPSHLSRKFKKEMGMTVIDYINKKRIEESKLYLKGNNIPITEIALMVGFNDLNYFTRVFKKITSMTPSQYTKAY